MMSAFRRAGARSQVAYVLASLGSFTAIITAARGVLDKFGRGDTLVSVINSLPFFLNSPFVGVLAIAVASWILWQRSRGPKESSGVVDSRGKAYRAPVHVFRSFCIFVGIGLLLGAATLCVFWFASHRIEFQVQVNKGTPATLGQGASKVKITLTESVPSIEEGKYSITAVLTSEGQSDVTMRNPKVGTPYNYPPEHGYRIKFHEASADNATFLVSKNP